MHTTGHAGAYTGEKAGIAIGTMTGPVAIALIVGYVAGFTGATWLYSEVIDGILNPTEDAGAWEGFSWSELPHR